MKSKITRRQFSKSLGGLSLGLCAAPLLGPLKLEAASPIIGNLTDAEQKAVTRYAYLLLPLLEEGHALYAKVAETLTQKAKQDNRVAAMLSSGIQALNQQKTPWLQLPSDKQQAMIRKQTNTPFFQLLHWTTTETVLGAADVWKQLGYQGSSIEYGGYLHRGFNDIDWLPSANGK